MLMIHAWMKKQVGISPKLLLELDPELGIVLNNEKSQMIHDLQGMRVLDSSSPTSSMA